jgi:hypothetical protein
MAESPESKVEPYESLDAKQERISGETFPKIILELCESCYWCATCINEKGFVKICPVCGKKTSKVQMSIDEMCLVEIDYKRGVVLHFDRKLPLR